MSVMNKRMQTKQETSERRSNMVCKTFELKIDNSHLPAFAKEHLNRLFLEAKWYYNHSLNHFNRKEKLDTKKNKVRVLTPSYPEGEMRDIKCLSSQMKQSLYNKIFDSISSLKELRKNGHKTGSLKFKSEVSTIPLKQYGTTYRLFLDKNQVSIQGLKKKLKVYGLDQLKVYQNKDMEFGAAKLMKICGDYYVHITVFVDKSTKIIKEKRDKMEKNDSSIGIDFGCETPMTFSNGIKLNFSVPTDRKIKKEQRKQSKKVKCSKNRIKQIHKVQKAHYKNTNRKNDIRNKIVSTLIHNYKFVCFQDEQLAAWQAGGHGKKINATFLGGIIRDLKDKSHTPVMVASNYPSTKQCPFEGGHRIAIKLSERVFCCEKHGFVMDRDYKSSGSIHDEAMRNINRLDKIIFKDSLPAERREFKPVEPLASTEKLLESFSKIPKVQASMVWNEYVFGNIDMPTSPAGGSGKLGAVKQETPVL